MQLLESLRNRYQARRNQPHDDYRGLLNKLATNQSVDDEQAAEILDTVGVSLNQLEADLERYRRREELRDTHSQLDARTAELEAIQADIANVNDAYEAERRAYQERIGALSERRRDASQRVSHSQSCGSSLQSWQPEWLSSAIGETKREREALLPDVGRRREFIKLKERELRDITSRGSEDAKTMESISLREAQLARLTAQLADMDKSAGDLATRISRLQKLA